MDELCGGALQLLSPLWDPPPTQETFWHFPFRGAHPLFLCLLTWMSLLMYKKSHRPSSLNVCHFACIIINDASCQEIIRIAVIISANCKSKFVTGHVGQPVSHLRTSLWWQNQHLLKRTLGDISSRRSGDQNWIFSRETFGTLPAVFVATKPGILSQTIKFS